MTDQANKSQTIQVGTREVDGKQVPVYKTVHPGEPGYVADAAAPTPTPTPTPTPAPTPAPAPHAQAHTSHHYDPASPAVTLQTGHSPFGHGKILFEQNPGAFRNIREAEEWLLTYNHYVDRSGHVYTCDDLKGNKHYEGPLKLKGETLVIPKGLKFDDSVHCVNNDVPPPHVPAPPPVRTPPPPAPPEPPVTHVRETGPVEFSVQSTPSDGPDLVPESTRAALELAARSGSNPVFTANFYPVKDIASRWPVVFPTQSGPMGSTDPRRPNGDMQLEGRHFLGENAVTRTDDGVKTRDGATGPRGFIGKEIAGPRGRENANGFIADITPDAVMHRDQRLGHPVPAYGGNYFMKNFLPVQVPLPIPSFVPVGAVFSSPRSQYVLPAGDARDGVTRAVTAISDIQRSGHNTAFRNEQSELTGPLATPDRIHAQMFLDIATREYNAASAAFGQAKTPEEARNAAIHMLVAVRDRGDNILTRRVDSMAIPMQEWQTGLKNYFDASGLDGAAIAAAAAAAPRIQGTDMPQAQLEGLRDYSPTNRMYENIHPGQTNPAYAQAMDDAYRSENHFESRIAQGRYNYPTEAALNDGSRAALQAVGHNLNAEKAYAAAVFGDVRRDDKGQPIINSAGEEMFVGNDRHALQIGMALADIRKNHENYGMTQEQANAFTDRYVAGGDKDDRRQMTNRGNTTPLPFIGADGQYAMSRPDQFARVVGQNLVSKPELVGELFDVVSNQKLGVDSHGRSDGRRFGTGFLREFGAEKPPAGSPDGTMPASYAAVSAALSDADKAVFHDGVLTAVGYERGNRGKQRIDNLYRAFEGGALGQGAIGGDHADEQRAALAHNGQGGDVTVFNAGAFDPTVVVNAAHSRDVQAAFNDIFRSQEARDTGSDQDAVLGLKAPKNVAIGRDAVLLTMLREPHAFDGAIATVKSHGSSFLGTGLFKNDYAQVGAALERTRDHAAKWLASGKTDQKEFQAAVESYGQVFSKIAAHTDSNGAIKKFNAWNDVFIDSIGHDRNASAWLMDTVGSDNKLMLGMMAGTPGALQALDNTHGGIHGTAGPGDRVQADLNGTPDIYQSRFFTLATDAKGKVTHGRVTVNGDLTAAVVAGRGLTQSGVVPQTGVPTAGTPNTAGTPPLAGAPISEGQSKLDLAHASNTSLVIIGKPGQSPEAILAAELKAKNVPLPAGVKSYEELANTAIQSGAVHAVANPSNLAPVAGTPETPNLGYTFSIAPHTAVGAGINPYWFLLLIHHPHKTNNPPTDQGTAPGCVDCPTITPPGVPTTPTPAVPIPSVPQVPGALDGVVSATAPKVPAVVPAVTTPITLTSTAPVVTAPTVGTTVTSTIAVGGAPR